MNLVELTANPEELNFDQPCKLACRVGSHSVYCHSDNEDSPRKCKLRWMKKEEIQDGDCSFFEPNSAI